MNEMKVKGAKFDAMLQHRERSNVNKCLVF